VAKLSPNITAVTLYSGQGKCREVEVYPGKGSVEMSIETAYVYRYMENLRSWARRINWFHSGFNKWSRPPL